MPLEPVDTTMVSDLDKAAKRRKLNGRIGAVPAVSDAEVLRLQLEDEALARRLHEELNALTRRARRGGGALPAEAGPAPEKQQAQQAQQPSPPAASGAGGKQGKAKAGATPVKNGKHPAVASPAVDVDASAGDGDAQQGKQRQQQQHGGKKGHKRSAFDRELSLLATDMVDAPVRGSTNGRPAREEGEQEEQQQPKASEAKEGRDAKEAKEAKPLVNRLLTAAHLVDHGATSSATSSLPEGGPTSSSGANDKAAQAGDSPMHRGGAGGHHKAASAAAGSSGARIPKLPMVQFGKKWYRSKLVREKGARVLIECQGLGSESGPIWLAKDGNRIWKGSMKGKDWRYLGDGAWEPKVRESSKQPHHKVGRAAKPKSSEVAVSEPHGDSSDAEDEPRPPAAAAQPSSSAAAGGSGDAGGEQATTSSGHDTGTTDQAAARREEAAAPALASADLLQRQRGGKAGKRASGADVGEVASQHTAVKAAAAHQEEQHQSQHQPDQQEEEEQLLPQQRPAQAQPQKQPVKPARRRKALKAAAAAAAAATPAAPAQGSAVSAEMTPAAVVVGAVEALAPSRSSTDPMAALVCDDEDVIASPRRHQPSGGRAVRKRVLTARALAMQSAAGSDDEGPPKEEEEEEEDGDEGLDARDQPFSLPKSRRNAAAALANGSVPRRRRVRVGSRGLGADQQQPKRKLKVEVGDRELPSDQAPAAAPGSPQGSSPRAPVHRRKGIPQRARMDSDDVPASSVQRGSSGSWRLPSKPLAPPPVAVPPPAPPPAQSWRMLVPPPMLCGAGGGDDEAAMTLGGLRSGGYPSADVAADQMEVGAAGHGEEEDLEAAAVMMASLARSSGPAAGDPRSSDGVGCAYEYEQLNAAHPYQPAGGAAPGRGRRRGGAAWTKPARLPAPPVHSLPAPGLQRASGLQLAGLASCAVSSRSPAMTALLNAVGELQLGPQLPALPADVLALPVRSAPPLLQAAAAWGAAAHSSGGLLAESRLLSLLPSLEVVQTMAAASAAATAAVAGVAHPVAEALASVPLFLLHG